MLLIATVATLLLALPLASAKAPKAPKDVTCVPQSDGVHVTWDAQTGATSYRVWRKVGNNGAWVALGTTTGTTYTDATAANGQHYHYAVSSINADGESDRGGTCNVDAIPFFPGLVALGAGVVGSVGIALAVRRKRAA